MLPSCHGKEIIPGMVPRFQTYGRGLLPSFAPTPTRRYLDPDRSATQSL